jgi:hypothetical protein
MRLWFWLQLRRLSFGLCSEKIKKNYINLWFFHYSIQAQDKGRTGARTGAAPYFLCWSLTNMMQLHSGSDSDSFPLTYIEKILSIYIKLLIFHCIGQRIGARVGARTGAASCWCRSDMKKWCGSGLGFCPTPIHWPVQWKFKDWYEIFIFSLHRPKDWCQSRIQKRSRIILGQFPHEKMMRFRFCL